MGGEDILVEMGAGRRYGVGNNRRVDGGKIWKKLRRKMSPWENQQSPVTWSPKIC